MKLLINEKEISLIYGNTFFKRLIGLMGKKEIKQGLYLPKCNNIHTFFMKSPIDILFINKNNVVISLLTNFKKNKITHLKDATSIIELPPNTINKFNIKINDNIKIVN